MAVDMGFDAPNEDPDDISGDCRLPTGWYLARVVRTLIDKDGRLCVTWMVEVGAHAGERIMDRLAVPALCMRSEEVPEAARRMWVFTCRMGITKKEEKGMRVNWTEAQLIGIRRVIEVKRGRAAKKPDDPKEWSNIVYGAYFDVDRTEIPVEARVAMGLPLLAGQTMPTAAEMGAKVVTPPTPSKNSGVQPGVPSMAFDPSEV